MTLTGAVYVDLRDVPARSMRLRVWHAVSEAPAGVRVVIVVGTLAPDPPTVDFLRGETERLHIEVQGSAGAVRRWLDGLRSPHGMGVLL